MWSRRRRIRHENEPSNVSPGLSSGMRKVATIPFVVLCKYSVKTIWKRKSATITSAVGAKKYISRTIYHKLLTIDKYPFILSRMIEWVWKCDHISAKVISCYVGQVISRFYCRSSLSCNAPISEAFSLLANRCLRPWVRILHSAEEDNLSPSDSNIACLCQSIEINNNKHVYRQSQVRKLTGSEVEWAECLLIIGTGCRVQVFSLILDSSVGLWAGIQSAGE